MNIYCVGACVEPRGRGRGGGPEKQAGQLNMCTETVSPSRGKSDGFGKNAPVFHIYFLYFVQQVNRGQSV